MKSLRFSMAVIIALVTIMAFAVVLHAQTRVVPTNLGSGGVAGPKLYAVLPSGSVALVDLGAGLTLDLTGTTPVLRAGAVASHRVHVQKILSPTPNLNLPEAPIAGTLRFHRNGVLWSEGEDYTVTNNTIVGANGQSFLPGDVLNAEYSY